MTEKKRIIFKYNLANRPKVEPAGTSSYEIVVIERYEEWFEGFEKQLEEVFDKRAKPMLSTRNYEEWISKLEKQILGDAK